MTHSYLAPAAACGCCFILPSDILRRLATHGDPDVAAAAGRTLRINASLRAFRSQLRVAVGLDPQAGLAVAAAPPPLAAAVTPVAALAGQRPRKAKGRRRAA